jgi:cell division protein FtsN
MARDYKKVSTRKKKKRQQAPGWVWLLTGLTAGLLVALLVYLKEHNSAAVVDKPAVNKKTRSASRNRHSNNRKLRYEFYTILPESEVVIPDQDLPSSKDKKRVAAFKPGRYILQAGSFRRMQDAEKRKASLALLGIVANIQTVNVNGDTWHRIRVGPFKTLVDINETRARLKENRINAILVKNR